MAKLKIIRSDSLECLRSRTNDDIDDAHRMIEQLEGEIQRNKQTDKTVKNLITQRNNWQIRIECYRETLNNIAQYASEIEI